MTSLTALGHHHFHSTPSTPVHHHSHFSHHVRATTHRAWGFEPGWKFVSRESQTTHRIPVSTNGNGGDIYDGSGGGSRTSSSTLSSPLPSSRGFEAKYGSLGSNSSSSSFSPFSPSLRGTSFRLPSSSPGNLLPHAHLANGTTHQTTNFSFRPQPTQSSSSTLPRSLKASLSNSDHSSLSSSSSSSSSFSSSSPAASAQFIPPGVLKKPGSYRGPKSMKKVAFLENAEFSRGVP